MKIQLKTPENNSVVSLKTDTQAAFAAGAGNRHTDKALNIDWLHLVQQGEDNTVPVPVEFEWTIEDNDAAGLSIWFLIAEDANFKNCKPVLCSGSTISVHNLLLGKTYYWKVLAAKDEEITGTSCVFCFTAALEPPRWIQAEGLSNVRDIGGWPLGNGKRIRQGLVFRGCEMEFHHIITENGKKTLLNELNIKTDLDLRGEAVGKVSCSALGANVQFCLIPVKAYNEFLEESEKDVCRKIFKLFTNKENYPFYIHCWGGADRTGTLIFLLCAILGMSEDDLYLDYELTSLSIWGERSRHSELFQAFLQELNTYGGNTCPINQKCKKYLLSAGVTEHDINVIKRILIED